LIASRATRVLALDYDEPAAAHVRRRYPEVDIALANLASLPVISSTVDVVVNFQVIEHLWDQAGFLTECHRVLRSGGRLLVTTPNRLTFTPDSDTPLNPYHTRELAPSELDSLLRAAGFAVEHMLGLFHGPGLLALDERYGGSIIDAQLEVVLGALPGQARWPTPLLADIEAVRASDFSINGEDLEASLDLIAVAVRP
jgi:SAM-dependent methyltransferase